MSRADAIRRELELLASNDAREARFRQRGAAFAERIGPELVAELKAMHDEYGYECCAASEGLWCCVDLIVGDADKGTGA